MDDPSIWSLLLSEKNISGVWVVIGAALAFIGVLANNFFENRRRKKDREHRLIRDAYFGGVEYINYYFNMIANLNQLGTDGHLNVEPSVTEKYYKLFMVASNDVIEAFTKLFEKNTSTVLKLGLITVDIKKIQGEINVTQVHLDSGLEMMSSANDRRNEYNEKKIKNQKLWDLYDEQYEDGLKRYHEASDKLDVLNKKFLKMQIKLLKDCLNAMMDLSPKMYDAITSMRKDLDRKLSKNEAKKIKNSIDAMMVQLKSDIDGFIAEIDKRIDVLTTEENAS